MASAIPPPRSIRSVCLVQLGGIGDLVHAVPVGNLLRRGIPGAELVWVANPAPAEVLQDHPAADDVIVSTGSGVHGLQSLSESFRGRRFDVTLNMRIYLKSVLPTLFSGAAVRLGMPKALTRDGVSWFNTHSIPGDRWRHWQDIYLDFLSLLRLPRTPVEWGIGPSENERDEQKAFYEGLGERPVVGVVLATANRKKDWPTERYASLVEALTSARPYTVLLLGGPSGVERAIASHVQAQVERHVHDCLGDSVRRLIWLLDGCDLVISPDTGPLHLAHAMEVPAIGLYGHTNPLRVGPYSRFHDLLIDRYTPEGREPDPSHSDPRLGRMEAIEVDDVLAKVDLAVARYGSGSRKRLVV